MTSSNSRTADSLKSTATRKKKQSRKALLSSTRPQLLHSSSKPTRPVPSSAGRALIRIHHTLQKRLTTALASHDLHAADALRAEIEALGGLSRYQDASLAGQGKERGGDTSGVLVSWLSSFKDQQRSYSMLEVGALSVDNACARSGLFRGGLERIDLKSRHPDIKTQDFMERPLPKGRDERFDVVSLSLVMNFVGDPQGRGQMLRRIEKFLAPLPRMTEKSGRDLQVDGIAGVDARGIKGETGQILLPALFLVLPASCVTNSRYMDEERLEAIMRSMGYTMTRRKLSAKLVYYLWRYERPKTTKDRGDGRVVFGKEEVRKGKDRNNFAIVLK